MTASLMPFGKYGTPASTKASSMWTNHSCRALCTKITSKSSLLKRKNRSPNMPLWTTSATIVHPGLFIATRITKNTTFSNRSPKGFTTYATLSEVLDVTPMSWKMTSWNLRPRRAMRKLFLRFSETSVVSHSVLILRNETIRQNKLINRSQPTARLTSVIVFKILIHKTKLVF